MSFWDIVGWTPDWREPNESIAANLSTLLEVVGDQVVAVSGVWHVDRDEWFADFPVVIGFASGSQLEVCWQKLSELSLTWNTITIDGRIHEDDTWQLQWRPLEIEGFDLAGARSASVEEIRGSRDPSGDPHGFRTD